MICLPWAGGNSTAYRNWEVPKVEVVAIELPGRNARLIETPMTDVHMIVNRLIEVGR